MNILNLFVKPAYAAICNPLLNNCEEQVNSPVPYFSKVIQALISIFFFVAVLYFLWHFIMSAFHMISSNGDAKKFEEGRNGLVNALLGLFVTFAVFAILKFVGTVLGISGLNNLNLLLPSL
jgi:hypothetical protein